MNQYVFLDIDGVLNGHEKFTNGYCGIDHRKMEILNAAHEAIGFRTIIISAWRYMILTGSMTSQGFENLLLTHGASLGLVDSIEGYIDKDTLGATKGEMIKDFVEKHKDSISTYLIIDDIDQGYTDLGLPFWRTNGKVGLCHKDAEEISRYFSNYRLKIER